MKNITRLLTAASATAALALVTSVPSYAAEEPLSITITGSTASVTADGFMPIGPTSVPPVIDSSSQYPTSDPVAPDYEAYTGNSSLLFGDTVAGETLLLYCAEILIARVDDYTEVTREEAAIGNAGYAARVVNSGYPTTNVPENYTLRSDKATVVQSAIWYFTDGFVIAESNPFHDDVAQLVNDAIAAGPVSEEETNAVPDLTVGITGPTEPVTVGTLAGPFTATAVTETTSFTLDAGGATVYLDAAGTQVLEPGTPIAPGQQFWVKSDAVGDLVVTANATVRAVSGLYFRGFSGEMPGQTLIGATGEPYPATASATVKFAAVPPAPPAPPSPTPVPALAATGSADVMPFIGLSALLVLAGGAAVIVTRRSSAAAKLGAQSK